MIEDCPPAVFASYLIRFRPTGDIEPRYLKWYLQSSAYWEQIGEVSAGIALQNVNAKKLAAIKVPLAPLAEQRRIVAALEEHLSDLDAAVAGLQRARFNSERFLGALIEKRVARIAEASGDDQEPLRGLTESLDQGWSPKCENSAAQHDQWAVIKTTAIQPLRFQPGSNKRLPAGLTPRQAITLRAGDLLITRAGPRSRVGVSCVVLDDQPRLMNCDKVYRVRLKQHLVMPEYVATVLNAPAYLRRLDALKTGISDSGVNLTQDRFLQLTVPVPTLPAQQALLAEVALHHSTVDHVQRELEVQLARAARLRQSILKRAFEGNLVPQDPSEEPVGALLAREPGPSTTSAAMPRTRGARSRQSARSGRT